ncbi:MAG TPA: hypothetical protein V6C58_02320 [Allocoleopsis sp.]
MKCILNITTKQYKQYKYFVVKYGELNSKNKQFKVQEITIPDGFPSYINHNTLKSRTSKVSEILYYIKHPINDWIDEIAAWLLHN